MSESVVNELLTLSRLLLDSIEQQDWSAYVDLCDPSLTAFEPEAAGHLVAGIGFHEFYFKPNGTRQATQSSISSHEVRLMGEVAVVTYVRLTQCVSEDGRPSTFAFEETRVWQRQDGQWKHVHFHRSPAGQFQRG